MGLGGNAHGVGVLMSQHGKSLIDSDWIGRANCRGVSPDIFFPTRGEPTDEAKAVCQGCAVRDECLESALINHDTHGVWGGTSENQRRKIRASRLKDATRRSA